MIFPRQDGSERVATDTSTDTHSADRRTVIARATTLALAVLMPTWVTRAEALSLADLTQKDAGAGVKAALEQGADIAVKLLGRENGFWGDERVRIPLPEWISKSERALKLIGRQKDIEDLKLGVNRAAEQAVPQAKKLLSDAVKSISVDDAKKILTGGDNSVTTFFKDKTAKPLNEKFLPVVAGVTDRIGIARQYNQLAGQVESTGLVKLKPEQRKVENHVTAKALDGLYFMIGEQEKKIRQDPIGAGSDILRRVFGSLNK
jgi:hypothetical protein